VKFARGVIRAATRKHTIVGQKYFKGGGGKRALRGKNILSIIK